MKTALMMLCSLLGLIGGLLVGELVKIDPAASAPQAVEVEVVVELPTATMTPWPTHTPEPEPTEPYCHLIKRDLDRICRLREPTATPSPTLPTCFTQEASAGDLCQIRPTPTHIPPLPGDYNWEALHEWEDA